MLVFTLLRHVPGTLASLSVSFRCLFDFVASDGVFTFGCASARPTHIHPVPVHHSQMIREVEFHEHVDIKDCGVVHERVEAVAEHPFSDMDVDDDNDPTRQMQR